MAIVANQMDKNMKMTWNMCLYRGLKGLCTIGA